jgi:hypothetical protein
LALPWLLAVKAVLVHISLLEMEVTVDRLVELLVLTVDLVHLAAVLVVTTVQELVQVVTVAVTQQVVLVEMVE